MLRVWNGSWAGMSSADDANSGDCATAEAKAAAAAAAESTASPPKLLACYDFNLSLDDALGSNPLETRAGDKFLPWCSSVDDSGRLRAGNGADLGELWGFCSDRKPLPMASGEGYNRTALLAMTAVSLPDLLVASSGCGRVPLALRGNRAEAGHGGAVYKQDCDEAADARGECFFGPFAPLSPSLAVELVDNSAGGAGGAVYVECGRLGTACDAALQAYSGLPLQPPLMEERWQPRQFGRKKLVLHGNVAAAWGDGIATAPSQVQIRAATSSSSASDPTAPLSIVPGVDILLLDLALLDGRGSLVRGSMALRNPYVLKGLVCADSARSCSEQASLGVASFHPCNRTGGCPAAVSGLSCTRGESNIRVSFSLSGSTAAAASMTVRCLPCQAGQRLEVGSSPEDMLPTAGSGLKPRFVTWRCVLCGKGMSILDPNDPSSPCFPCPDGAICPGGAPPLFHAMGVDVTVQLSGADFNSSARSVSGALWVAVSSVAGVDRNFVGQAETCGGGIDGWADTCSVAVRRADGDRGTREGPAPAEIFGLRIFVGEDDVPAVKQLLRSEAARRSLELALNQTLPGVTVAAMDAAANPQTLVRSIGSWVLAGGRYRLADCPQGYLIVNLSTDEQACQECQPGSFAMSATDLCDGGVCAPRSCSPCPSSVLCSRGSTDAWEHFAPRLLMRGTQPVPSVMTITPKGRVLLTFNASTGNYAFDRVLPAGPESWQMLAQALGVEHVWEFVERCAPAFSPCVPLDRGVMYLRSCPAGFAHINSSQRVTGFEPELQTCAICEEDQYILDSERPPCINCPMGGVCMGGRFRSLFPGSVWVAEGAFVRIRMCPAGYILVRDDTNVFSDTCVECPNGKYSLVNATYSIPKQARDLWTHLASDAVGLCLNCPDGFKCLGGASIVDADFSVVAGSDVGTLCLQKMSVCGTFEHMSVARILIYDRLNRSSVGLSFQVFFGDGNELNGTAFPSLESVGNGTLYSLNFPVRLLGTQILAIYHDGQQLSNSPFRLQVVRRSCQEFPGRMAGVDGECYCQAMHVDVGGSCVSIKMLLSATLVPLSVLVVAALIALHLHHRARATRVWRIRRNELTFPVPEEELGISIAAVVVKAEFRSTPVAVKCYLASSQASAAQHGVMMAQTRCERIAVTTAEGEKEWCDPEDTNDVGDCGCSRGKVTRIYAVAVGRLSDQARLLVQLRHPCIVTVMGAVADRHSRRPFALVMELMELGSLRDILQNRAFPLEAEIALGFIQGMARGMAFLHALNPPVIHGDLRPTKVLIDRHFAAKIADPASPLGPTCLRGGAAPFWTPPEMLAGTDGTGDGINGNIRGVMATRASDVYAFGVVLYECLSRQCPYDRMELSLVLNSVSSGKVLLHFPPDTSPEASITLSECLRMEPAQRPAFPEIDRRFAAIDPNQFTSPAFASESRTTSGRSSDSFSAAPAHGVAAAVGQQAAKLAQRRHRRGIHGVRLEVDGNADGTNRMQADLILRDLFPADVAEALMTGKKIPPERKEMITMYFSDIVGFTTLSTQLSEDKVSEMLDRLYERFDEAAESLGVYKIETIGDAYLCAANLVRDQTQNHAALMARFALAAAQAARETPVDPDNESLGNVRIRIGLHSGPCMAGVVGRRSPKYTVFGDTINTASRMESSSEPGRIQCSRRTADLIRDQDSSVVLRRRGEITVKGKGTMETFWVIQGDKELDGSEPDCSVAVGSATGDDSNKGPASADGRLVYATAIPSPSRLRSDGASSSSPSLAGYGRSGRQPRLGGKRALSLHT